MLGLMAVAIDIHEAKTNFSKLLRSVQLGEEIVIAKAGKPVARLVPITKQSVTRKPGTAKGLIKISPDFDAPLPEDLFKPC